MNIIKKSLTAIALVASFSSSAALVTVEEWHETGDYFGGMKQSMYSEDIFFAVSKNTYLDLSSSYEIMSGYRLASFEEYSEIVISSGLRALVYYNQGGWDGYYYKGQRREIFSFSGTSVGDGFLHAGNYENYLNYRIGSPTQFDTSWAGFVLIKDESSSGGFYNFSTSNFTSNDVPVPIMFGALGLALIGFSKRKKS